MAAKPTSRDVAEWMLAELNRDKYLSQETAVEAIEARFGRTFVYENSDGGWSISREVLREFRALTEGRVVWDRSELEWRFRERDDPSSGRVAE